MTLRNKAIFIICLSMTVGIMMLYFFSQGIVKQGFLEVEKGMQQGFASLETAATIRNILRVTGALDSRIAYLSTKTTDWAQWNDTYQFVEDNNQAYIKSNLGVNSLIGLKTNLMMIINASGSKVFSMAFDLENQKEVAIPTDLKNHLQPDSLLLKHKNSDSEISGIISLSVNPMMIVSRPIIKSDKSGEIRGSLIFGRFLDKAEFADIGKLTQLTISCFPVAEKKLPPDFHRLRSEILSRTYPVIEVLNSNIIAGYSAIRDLYGSPVLLLRVDLPRRIFKQSKVILNLIQNQGQLTLYSLVYAIIFVSFLLAVLIIFMLEHSVLSRLKKLNIQAANIGNSSNFQGRIETDGKDEIADLGASIDSMLKNLALSHHELATRNNELRAAQKSAEKACLAKSVFLDNMSHEVRTPMNAIMGFAQVLERDPALTPLQAEHLKIITNNGTHLLRLINDILGISRTATDKIIIKKTAFCLNDLLKDLEVMFRSRADAKGLQFILEQGKNVPSCVIADESKLQQILVNLLGNAIKFTKTGLVKLRADIENLSLIFEIEDTGLGISNEDMSEIFEPFQQGAAAAETGGLGLGLPVSGYLANLIGGKITVTSKIGKGSCFRFEIPFESTTDIPHHEKPRAKKVIGLQPGSGKFRILVADDMPGNRALLCALLRPVGFEVAEAVNGEEALKLFDLWAPHALFMDMHMPVMNGYEATKRLKNTEAGRNTPVIAATGSCFIDAEVRIMAAGADAYLHKPFRPDELFEVLGKFLKLDYVYADEQNKRPAKQQTSPHTGNMSAMPQEILQKMRLALTAGDINHLTELIAQTEAIDSLVARSLKALADCYDYKKLGECLNQGGDIK